MMASVSELDVPPPPAPAPEGAVRPLPGRKEAQLDPALQSRLLAQMHEEQAAALRQRELMNWVLLPIALVLIVGGTVLSFSSNLTIAFVANTIATGILWVLWKANRERIRGYFGK